MNKNKEINLRFAEERDCRQIYAWRNDPEVRKIAFSSEEILYEKHEEWFRHAVRDPNRTIFIIMNENFEDVGNVRFDRKNRHALVNIIIGWDYVGRGYGTKALIKSTMIYFYNFDIEYVIAEIRERNIASIKAFERAGYKLHEKHEDKYEYRIYREDVK